MSALIGVLCVYSASLAWDLHALKDRTRNLIQESRNLQQTLNTITRQQSDLLAGSQASTKEKQTLLEMVESLKKENESLGFRLKKIEAQTASVKEEKSYLEEMLINKTKQIDILNSQSASPPAIAAAAVPDAGEIQSRIDEKEGELQKLNEENRLLQQKLDRLYKTTNEKINEINVAKIALAETVSGAQKKIEDEWNTVDLGSVTTHAMAPSRQNDIEETPVAPEPKSAGHVLAINNEHGFVVIDLGKVDNLPDDALLEVKKESGVPVATLSVLEIRDVMAACNIKEVQDGQRIEINDLVSILR